MPFFSDGGIEIHHGRAETILMELVEDGRRFDALWTDPPYSSGGLHAGSRRMNVADKYAQNGNALGRPLFGGDGRDQRSMLAWCSIWLGLCRDLLREGSYVGVFSDWRQLPLMSDAIQAADFLWRGIVVWDKTPGSRAPHKGYFRHQSEFVTWGTLGHCEIATHAGPFDGVYREFQKRTDKHHLTGKPLGLMRHLLQTAKPGETILDPFGGSMTTGVAAAELGLGCVLIDESEAYCEIGARRMEAALKQRRESVCGVG